MRPLSKTHGKILATLTRGLDDDNSHRRIDNASGAFMAVVVEKIGPARYSVAHYFEQNGDQIADPDLELVEQNGAWFPVAITQWCGYQRVAETDEHGRIVTYKRKAYADLRSFAATLLTNIKRQQGNLSPTATSTEGRARR